jgi:hypothetical protein
MAIPLLGGILGNSVAEFVEAIPLNLEPMTPDGKMGQFRSAIGAVTHATGPGVGRGGIVWNGVHYRVMGTKLVSVGDTVTVLGDVGGEGRCGFDYSFDRLGIRSGSSLWYWTTTALTQVTDPDLGPVRDMLWIDGYWMTTDGTSIIVTELTDPTSIEALKYGSAEEDPDMVTGLMKVRGEVYVLGRHTIEVMQNAGGTGFPFAKVEGAIIPFGCVSATAKCYFGESFAFVGSARGEALGVFIAGQGTATKVSSRAMDDALASITDPAAIEMEQRCYGDERRLVLHLPNGETWVFCETASNYFKQRVWYRTASGHGRAYRLRNAVEFNGQWYCDDTESADVGRLSKEVSTHFGEPAEWEFHTPLIEGDGQSFTLKSIEMIGLPGRIPHGDEAVIFMSWSRDAGQTFGSEMALRLGGAGARRVKMEWRPRVRFSTYAVLRFRGYDTALAGIAKLVEDI